MLQQASRPIDYLIQDNYPTSTSSFYNSRKPITKRTFNSSKKAANQPILMKSSRSVNNLTKDAVRNHMNRQSHEITNIQVDLNPYNQNHEQSSTQNASKRGRASVADHRELDDIVKSNQIASNNLNKNVEEVILANEKLM